MNEPFTFYRALDPMKGSWDGYGFLRLSGSDFLAYVTDAPSVASSQTPEIIRSFWNEYCKGWAQDNSGLPNLELADGINRLQEMLARKSRQEGAAYQATLSIAYKQGDQLYYCTIGDSPLSLFRKGRLYRLSESEVWDGGLILQAGQTCHDRQKTGTLQFVGNGGFFVSPAEIRSLKLQKEDLLILHSDGVEDLLKPDQMLALLKKEQTEWRTEMERIFTQERLKDDVTIMIVPVEVLPVFDPEKEIRGLKASVDSLRKEQASFLPSKEMERVERNLQQLTRQIQNLTKRVENMGIFFHYQEKRWFQNPVVWGLLTLSFVTGVALGLSFLYLYEPTSQHSVTVRPAFRSAPVTPPVIEPVEVCTYTIQKGDTLEAIARAKHLTVTQLKEWNPLLKKDPILKPGQQMNICGEKP